MNHASHWATRITNEAAKHEENSFLTLTYADEHLPDPPAVSRRALQLFLKRIRKAFNPQKLRFFACGEYGTQLFRPHYHVILFGTAFRKDRYLWNTVRGNLYYRSPTLEAAWPYGHATIGDVTKESAGYVARYSLKKAQSFHLNQGDPYQRVNAQTGEVYTVHPEFIQMSNRPGIGFTWADEFRADAFPSGFVVIDGQKTAVPSAYRRRALNSGDTTLEKQIFEMDNKRVRQAWRQAHDNTPERLATKEEVLHLRAEQLKRDLE